MRSAAAIAAAVLLSAFVAPGCGLVDSLSPFGIGTQDYSAEGENVNGNWAGTTASGGNVTFLVGDNTVLELLVTHAAPECTIDFDASEAETVVVDGRFTVEVALPQGRFVADGTFTSGSACSGTYLFEGLPAGTCPSAGTGTFTANKTSI